MSGLFDRLREWRDAPSTTASADVAGDPSPFDFDERNIVEIGKPEPQISVADAYLYQLQDAAQVIAALVLGYCHGEARITAQFMDGIRNARVETHVEPDGTRIVKVHR